MSKTLDIKSFCLNKSSLIEASAGTGKTYTITYLVLRLLLGSGTDETALPEGPLPLENILIVTFTNAATSDLRARVREKIRQARLVFEACAKGEAVEIGERQMLDLIEEFERKKLPFKDGARILLRAERSIDDAAICTIHSFCNRALNQIYAFEAGQAFEKTLIDDISYYEDLACRQVWRELFYQTSEESRLVLSALKLKEPQDLKSVAQILQQCRLSNPRAQVQGYALCNYKYLSPKCKTAAMAKELFFKLAKAKSGEIAAIKALFDDFAKDVPPDTLKRMLKRDDEGKWRAGEYYKAVSAKRKNPIKIGPATFIEALIDFYSQGGSSNEKALQAVIRAITNAVDKKGSLNVRASFVSRSSPDKYLKDFENGAELNAIESRIAALTDDYSELLKQTAALTNEFTAALGIYMQSVLEQILDEHKLMSNDEVLRALDYALNHRRGHSDELSALIRERYRVAMIDEFQDTDPTQFAIFERLYLREEAKGRARCYLIGDPKQSIYAFRGSDINSYLKARIGIQKLYDDAVYTLDTNYRSDPKVVAGVNELFGRNDNPFENESIGFERVNAQSGKLHFHFEGEDIGGTYLCCLPPGSDRNKDVLKNKYARACAFKILQILKHGVIEDKNGSRKVRPSDIAILVRGVRENNLINNALRALNLSSVYFSDKQSVFKTSDKSSYGEPERPSEAALAMLALIEAMARPYHREKLKRLLGSALLSKSGEEFEASLQEHSFEQEVMILYEASRRWREGGFLSAFSWWISHPLHQGIQRQLSIMGGERLLTDCYHIAEIMQEAHGSKGGPEAQVRYYRELMDESRGEAELNSKAVVKRLESERSQIQVRTIHNSKGLEFPIVMMPFMWASQSKPKNSEKKFEGVLYYDAQEKMRMLDLNIDHDESSQIAQKDAAAESVRLTYVALTRACAANFLFISDPGGVDAPDSLVRLLSTEGGYEDVIAQAERMGFAVEKIDPAIISGELEIAPYEPDAQESPQKLKPSVLPEGAVDSSFVITSYTDVVRGIGRNLHGSSAGDESGDGYFPVFDADKNDDENEQMLSLQGKERKILDCRFTFPRGSRPGLFLHALLEHTPFDEFKLPWDLAGAVAAKLGTGGLCALGNELSVEDERLVDGMVIKLLRVSHEALKRADGSILQEWIESGSLSHGEGALSRSLASWLCDMVYAKLADRSLSEVQKGDFVPEMRYLLPAHNLDLTKLNEVVVEHNQRLWRKLEDLGQAPSGFKLSDLVSLPADTVAGFVTGSLDLVCAFCDQDGHKRYSVIDYKSNHLGFGKSDYNLKAMAASIFEHRYDVQLLFYTLALKRYLQVRMKDFDYKRDMGCVHYLFLRGMSAAGSGHYGVFSHQVDEDIVLRMDELFGTEERL